MKKIYHALTLFLVLQSPFKTIAQCNPAIPNNANVVDSTQTVNGGFTPQWVCKDDTLFSGGGIFFVYLETGAVMSTGGGIDSIYVKNGATIIMNGGIHVILHEPLAILNVTGGIPTYYPCNTITFDYTNAPLIGCFNTSVLDQNTQNIFFSVTPNPFTDELTVSIPIFREKFGDNKKAEIKIYDVFGRIIYVKQFPTAYCLLLTSHWQQGIYFVEVITEKERMVKKIVKQ